MIAVAFGTEIWAHRCSCVCMAQKVDGKNMKKQLVHFRSTALETRPKKESSISKTIWLTVKTKKLQNKRLPKRLTMFKQSLLAIKAWLKHGLSGVPNWRFGMAHQQKPFLRWNLLLSERTWCLKLLRSVLCIIINVGPPLSLCITVLHLKTLGRQLALTGDQLHRQVNATQDKISVARELENHGVEGISCRSSWHG